MAASNRRDIGREFEVLVEGVSKRSTDQFVGRTSQNKTAVFPRGDHRVGASPTQPPPPSSATWRKQKKELHVHGSGYRTCSFKKLSSV